MLLMGSLWSFFTSKWHKNATDHLGYDRSLTFSPLVHASDAFLSLFSLIKVA